MDESIIMRRLSNGLLPQYWHMALVKSYIKTSRATYKSQTSETEQDTHSQNLGGTTTNPKAVEETLQ